MNKLFLALFLISTTLFASSPDYLPCFFKAINESTVILSDTDIVRAEELSQGVFLLTDSEGKKWVIRLPFNHADLKKEQYAVRFLEKTAAALTSTPRLLSPELSDKIKTRLKQLAPQDYASYLRSNSGFSSGHQALNQISLAVFIGDGYLGRDFLYRPGRHLPFILTLISILTQRPKKGEPYFKYCKGQLTKNWRDLTAQQRIKMHKIVSSLWPSARRVKTSEFLNFILQNMQNLSLNLEDLQIALIHSLDPSLRQKISDFWLANIILGIPDGHASNWILKDDQVYAIDLAHPLLEASDQQTSPLKIKFVQSPYGYYRPTDALIKQILSDASQSFIEQLKKITPQEIKNMANEAGYELSNDELQDTMKRIAYIIQMRELQ